MTDRLSLANALADAKIERSAAERIATEIFEAIHDSVATKSDIERLETQIAGLRAEIKSDLRELELRLGARIDRLEMRIDRVDQRIELIEHRLLIRLGGLMVVLLSLLFGALRYLPPVH